MNRPPALPGVTLTLLSLVFAAFQEPQEMIIRGGVIVTVDGRNEADLRVRDGAIVEIGRI